MPYPIIPSRRMAYDIDGTEIGFGSGRLSSFNSVYSNGITSWLSGIDKNNLNGENKTKKWDTGTYTNLFWFFFPELREITNLAILYNNTPWLNAEMLQGSDNTTNGMDGTWENAVCTFPTIVSDADGWRKNIFAISFSKPIKVLRYGASGGAADSADVCGIHIYGQKAAGQTLDDIVFCYQNGIEITNLTDWGDVPEGTTQFKTFYMKNISPKQANGVNIQLNHNDFLMSTDQVNWKAVIDIISLGAGQISQPIYIKLNLSPPLLVLGPKASRTIVTIASWT